MSFTNEDLKRAEAYIACPPKNRHLLEIRMSLEDLADMLERLRAAECYISDLCSGNKDFIMQGYKRWMESKGQKEDK